MIHFPKYSRVYSSAEKKERHLQSKFEFIALADALGRAPSLDALSTLPLLCAGSDHKANMWCMTPLPETSLSPFPEITH